MILDIYSVEQTPDELSHANQVMLRSIKNGEIPVGENDFVTYLGIKDEKYVFKVLQNHFKQQTTVENRQDQNQNIQRMEGN